MKTIVIKSKLGITTILITLLLVGVKYVIYQFEWELFSINALYTSAVGGALFIMGFLLAGVFSDYKEAEETPAELRSALESIFEDAKTLKQANPAFDLEKVKNTLQEIMRNLFEGLEQKNQGGDLTPVLQSFDKLLPSFVEMEALGVPANHIVRLKSERSNAKKIILRIEHIQKIQFVPSVYFLAESIMVIIIGLLLLLKSGGLPEFFVLFGFLSYLFLYIARLIPLLEKPFRQGYQTFDDVSLFLLHKFEEKLKA